MTQVVTPKDSLPPPADSAHQVMGNPKGSMKDSPKLDTLIITGDSVLTAAQVDSSAHDTSQRSKRKLHLGTPKEHYDPRIAVRRSALLPGWGQVYNNRLWKVPIIYAGFGVLVAFIVGNHQGYLEYDRAVKCKGIQCANDPFPAYSLDNIIAIREQYRRFRDLSVILSGVWYLLNVVDAYVDAHMREFNVSDELSLRVRPDLGIDPFRNHSLTTGVSLTFRLR